MASPVKVWAATNSFGQVTTHQGGKWRVQPLIDAGFTVEECYLIPCAEVERLNKRVPVVCGTCAGSGKVPEHQAVLRGNVNYVRCDDCEGNGATWREGE